MTRLGTSFSPRRGARFAPLKIALLAATLGGSACGGDSGAKAGRGSTAAPVRHALPPGSHSQRPANVAGPQGAAGANGSRPRSTNPERNPESQHGSRRARVYVEAGRICATSTPERVAKSIGSKSAVPRDIARTLARGYLPKLRKTAFEGCLAALG